nr:MAG TPA: hypothetical protein [Caudoviricetes sp.]
MFRRETRNKKALQIHFRSFRKDKKGIFRYG